MGGAVGHLMHLYDNRELTFEEIKDILSLASSGKLEKVSEKLDGLNLVFSWDISEQSLKVARSGGDIKRGGMDALSLSSKFSGRGNLEIAFNSAFSVLRGAISALPDQIKRQVFGHRASKWYSVEVIYTDNPNVINYDSNNVIFHGWPVFNVTSSGDVEMADDDAGGVDILSSNIDKMQKAVSIRGWQVRGPALVRMKELSNKTILKSTLSAIDLALSDAGINSSATIGEYLRSCLKSDATTLDLPEKIIEMIVARCMGDPDAPNLVAIRKNSDKSKHETINDFVRNCPNHLKSYVRPIEIAINDFAVELLRGLESTLIADTDAEVRRLRDEVQKAAAAIKASGDERAMSVLNTQLQKLRELENITSPVEGVVFIYRGNAYKFTGSFAAANQILGLFKYSRNVSIVEDK